MTDTHPSRPFYTLRLYVDTSDQSLRSQYELMFVKQRHLISEYIRSGGNQSIACPTIDAGIDLYIPQAIHRSSSPTTATIKVRHGVHCAMYFDDIPCGFYMYPRSSISKTGMRLANSVGVIDAGYRGDVMAVMDVLPHTTVSLEQHDRIVQICAPNLTFPICPVLVDSIEALGGPTIRGSGGFGSTGA
jgi:dUTP pyrophosphatase